MPTLHLSTALRHLPLTTGLAVSTLFAATVHVKAQDAGSGTATRLETLEVQAESDDILVQDGYVAKSGRIGTKMDTPLVDVPQSISTVTEKQLEDQKPRSLNEALDYTASANVNAYGFDPRFDAFTIRGFPITYNGVFRDGLRQYASPTGLFFTEIYGLEGISVLKGPSSTLYGAGAAGGIVDLMTKRPTEEPFREIELIGGSHDRLQGNVDLSGPVNADGTLLYRLTGVIRDSGTELPGFPDDRYYFAPAITWQPDGDTKLTVLGEVSKRKIGGSAAYYNDANGITDILDGDPRYNDFDQSQQRIGYEFEKRLNDTFTFRQNFRYAHLDNDLEYAYVTDVTNGVVSRSAGRNAEELHTVVVDTQLLSEFDTGPIRHRAVSGIDYGFVTYDQRNGFGAIPTAGENLPLNFNSSQDFSQIGVYTQDRMELGQWAFTGGLRYDWLSTETEDATHAITKLDDEQLSGFAALSYHTDWGIVPYVNYSTAFTPNVGTLADGSVAKPTVAEQKEIGVKYEIPGYNAFVSAALFDIQQTDGVVFDASTGVNQQYQFDLRSRGFELEGQMSLLNGLSLLASYAYVDMEIESGRPGTIGKTLSATPFHTASIWADYTIQDGAAEGLGFGGGVRYVGKSFGNDLNTIVNDPRIFVDATMHYDFGARNPKLKGLRLQVNATNLTDNREVTCSAGYCYRDEGRMVVGSLRYRW